MNEHAHEADVRATTDAEPGRQPSRIARRSLIIGATAAALTASSFHPTAASAAAGTDGAEFVPTIEAFVSARNASLLEPQYAAKAFAATPNASALLQRGSSSLLAKETAARDALKPARAVMALSGVRYTDSSTKITVTKTVLKSNTATVSFTEEDRYVIDGLNGEYTGQVVKRIATFERVSGVWTLKALAAGEDFSGLGKPINEPAANDLAGKQVSLDAIRRELNPTPDQALLKQAAATATPTASFAPANRQAVIDYALYYALASNSYYRTFSNGDCTNFVSQSLRNGGWGMISGAQNTQNAWWYRKDTIPDSHSNSWGLANTFYYHATVASKRLRYVAASTIWVGDVVEVKFKGDSILNHAMIVTGRTKAGWAGILLSYHSTNRRNMPISSFAALSPGATYYPLRLL